MAGCSTAMMNERRRQELRERYIRLTNEYDRLRDGLDCGRTLAGHINPRLSEIDRELRAIETEVLVAIRQEQP